MALPDTTISTLDLLRRLKDHQVEFVVIGGIAANVHGSATSRASVILLRATGNPSGWIFEAFPAAF